MKKKLITCEKYLKRKGKKEVGKKGGEVAEREGMKEGGGKGRG